MLRTYLPHCAGTVPPEPGCRFHGRGSLTLVGGNGYAGDLRQNQMHGDGVFTWVEGVRFAGKFERNQVRSAPAAVAKRPRARQRLTSAPPRARWPSQMTKCGRYTWPDGSVYEGQIRDGKRHGLGRMRCGHVPSIYVGHWDNGLRHGHGTCVYNEDGTCVYKGQWRRDARHGLGLMLYPSGNTYVGQWRRGMKNGPGVMTWVDRGERYKGGWKDDLPHGQGEHVWLERRNPEEKTTTQRQVRVGGSGGGSPTTPTHRSFDFPRCSA